ncbi:MAG: bifunctional 5,10-methylene-tetrahydrofolate dehydrogenase/5,10-methylene-tetrahydrofolate cyclohydrolase [Firmicutes bacterium]|nr:bifunctional 5,10-methylene-tetrahydrofolate dehydrogenase/5,10-methylene-tetrahydrofolate cyclohydrolase [Bacillota bacterium]
MAAKVINGEQIAREVREQLKSTAAFLKSEGITPGLAIVVLKSPVARIHVARLKERACRQLGIYCRVHYLAEDTTKAELEQLLIQLNADPKIHGVNIHPLPPSFDHMLFSQLVAPHKDIEVLHFLNMGNFFRGEYKLIPYVAKGIMRLITATGESLAGKRAVVVGRSRLVGKPVALLLLERGIAVSICHSQTPDLAAFTKKADLLVVAAGKPRLITQKMVKTGAIVIDVGVNFAGTRLVGDVDYWDVKKTAGWITPVPGGVGPMTITMLFENLLEAVKVQ